MARYKAPIGTSRTRQPDTAPARHMDAESGLPHMEDVYKGYQNTMRAIFVGRPLVLVHPGWRDKGAS